MARFSVLSSIESTLQRWAANLTKGLTFGENLAGYEWQGSIEAGQEFRITHDLLVTPSRFLILDAKGVNTIVRSPLHAPTGKFFFVKNIASTTTFTGRLLIVP